MMKMMCCRNQHLRGTWWRKFPCWGGCPLTAAWDKVCTGSLYTPLLF